MRARKHRYWDSRSPGGNGGPIRCGRLCRLRFWSLCADAVSVRYETEQVLAASAGGPSGFIGASRRLQRRQGSIFPRFLSEKQRTSVQVIESTEVVPEDTDQETGTREAGPSEDRVVETLRTERAGQTLRDGLSKTKSGLIGRLTSLFRSRGDSG